MVLFKPGVSMCELWCQGLATAQVGNLVGCRIGPLMVCDDCLSQLIGFPDPPPRKEALNP